MVPLGRLSGCTSWIIWLRKPRLYKALASVAVLTPFSLSRVSAFKVTAPLLLSVSRFLSSFYRGRLGPRLCDFAPRERIGAPEPHESDGKCGFNQFAAFDQDPKDNK